MLSIGDLADKIIKVRTLLNSVVVNGTANMRAITAADDLCEEVLISFRDALEKIKKEAEENEQEKPNEVGEDNAK